MSRAAACSMDDAPDVQDGGAVHFLAAELVWGSIAKLFVLVRDIVNADIARSRCRGVESGAMAGRKGNYQRT